MPEKVTDITSLFKTFKSDREKQEFCEIQFAISVALQKQIKQLEDENKHLKELLTSTTHLMEPTKIIVTPEEALIDGQINILEQRGREHELTLEETKKLDLFLKNKNLIKQQPTTIQGESKPIKSLLSKKELLLLASKKDENE